MQAVHIPTEELEAVLDKRADAMQHLLSFTQYTKSDYVVGPHHELICDALERLERGDIDRLMIQAPPRHGKSELASRRFPAWYLGRNPTHQIIAASHGDAFARDIAIDVRQVIESPEYGELFDAKLNPSTRAADNWRLTQGGMYYGVGIGGSSVGRGAHLLVIDDPIKGRQEADSLTERDRAWRWYQSVAYPRLMKNGKVILIFTSWHTDDLGHRILENAADGEWKVLKLPAIDDDGAALWPDEFPVDRLERIRTNIGEREWNAQYQQEPAPETGNFFNRGWFDDQKYSERPESLVYYISTDFGVTETGDPSELGVFGVDSNAQIFVVDWWHGKETADVTVDALLDLAAKYRPRTIYGETGQIRRSLEPFIKERMRERGLYFHFEWLHRNADKAAMATAFRAKASMGDVHFPALAWADRVIEQLVSFPAARHDDCVDTCALIGLALDEVRGQKPPKPFRSRRRRMSPMTR